MIDLDYVFTRFVIIEKHIGYRYDTPNFNQYGEIVRYTNWGGFGRGRIFVSPGIYTREETPALGSNLESIMYVAGVDVATSSNPVDVNIIVSYTIE